MTNIIIPADENNNLTKIVNYLETLKRVYADEVMPTVIDDGDHEERIEEIQTLIDWLQKTN